MRKGATEGKMMIQIDMENGKVTVEDQSATRTYAMGTPEAFTVISKAWLRCGWDNKHVYTFTWMGRPIIQLPEDMVRLQEVIYQVKPDVIVETGVAHGGSLVFYASLFKSLNRGRAIGVDIEIRAQNRKAIEDHPLSEYISLIEGSSIDSRVVDQVKALIKPKEKVMVILDSNHSKDHVLNELKLYGSMVSPGSYMVACDGIMKELVGAPRTDKDWGWNNPFSATQEFLKSNTNFSLGEPKWLFNEGTLKENITYWPGAWLRKK